MKKVFLILAVAFNVAAISAQEEELTPMQKLEQQVEVLNEKAEKQSALKVSGYFQPQWQFGQPAAALRVGGANTGKEEFNRFGVRRGRLKFEYNDGGLASGVFQLNIIDKEGLKGATVQLKEAYVNVKDPFFQSNAITLGVMNRPFGNEVGYSSSSMETPERSRMVNALFPEECDLGVQFTLKPSASSDLNFIKFEGGLFAGNAINPETDNRKDFIGHLVATKPIGSWAKWGAGVSYYNGGVYQTNSSVYNMSGESFVKTQDDTQIGQYAKREYYGVDGQFTFETESLGMTQVRAEYIFGTQPGTKSSSSSPNRAALPASEDTYIRPMSGWYAIFIQDLGSLPISAVAKYEVYDPNTSTAGEAIKSDNNTSATDLKYSTLGLGAYWRVSPGVRLTAVYDIVTNETSSNLLNATNALKDFSKDVADNVLTIRLQYKF